MQFIAYDLANQLTKILHSIFLVHPIWQRFKTGPCMKCGIMKEVFLALLIRDLVINREIAGYGTSAKASYQAWTTMGGIIDLIL